MSFAAMCVVNQISQIDDNLNEVDVQRTDPILPVSIGSKKALGLFDTGSKYSLMDLKYFKKVQHEVDFLPMPLVTLTSASGDKIKFHAHISCKMKFGEKTWRRIEFLVVDKVAPGQCLIGMQFMQQNGCEIGTSTKRIAFTKKTKPINADWGIVVKGEKGYFEAKYETKVNVVVNHISEVGKQVLIECVQKPNGLEMMDGLSVTSRDEKGRMVVPCVLTNMTNNKIHTNEIKFNVTEEDDIIVHSIFPTKEEDDKLEVSALKQIKVKPEKLAEVTKFVNEAADLSQLPKEYKQKYFDLLVEYETVFSRHHLDVGDCPIMPHKIELKDPTKIVNIPSYRMPHHLEKVAQQFVDEMLAAGVIRASNSPYSSPLMLVKKANADPRLPATTQFRLVHNYKALNENIQPSSYPLKNLYAMIDNVSQGTVYSVLDLSMGYFNQRLVDPLGATAFSVIDRGQMQYLRSPMGVNSSPSSFQMLIDYIFRGINRVYCYLDDIVVSTKDYEQNLVGLRAALFRMVKYKLKVNLRKAKFGALKVDYLGYEISDKSIQPGMRKTQSIISSRAPRTVRQIRQFIGLCSFFRKCIPNFSSISSPLNKLIRKDNPYLGGLLPEESLKSFRELQKALSSRPTLTPVDWHKDFIVTADTSGYAHGALLTQVHNGIKRPCAYASKMLSEAQTKKPAYDREKEGVRWAMKHFRPYLLGKEFLMRTDHKPLLALNKGNTDLLDNVSNDIRKYLPFKVEYVPGTKIPADHLSRPFPEESKIPEELKNNSFSELPRPYDMWDRRLRDPGYMNLKNKGQRVCAVNRVGTD